MWTAMASACITSSMFLTALAPNVLAQSLVEKTTKVAITWNQWFMSFLPVGIILFLATPLLTYVLYPPSQKSSDDAPTWAGAELTRMGSITGREILMALLAVSALVGWIFFKDHINPTTVALATIALMVLCKVVSWEDIVGYKQAWNVLVWFATLVTLAEGLSMTGFLKWFGELIAGSMQGMSPTASILGLLIAFFATHYMFASITAHVAAMLPVMLVTAMNVPGLNISLVAMLLCSTLGIMGIITPYGAGHNPIYYGSGYIKGKDWWVLGFIFGAIYLGVFVLVGLPWNL
jgi:L-tartrate/succinate antiporter